MDPSNLGSEFEGRASLSLVIPAFNEEQAIAQVLEEAVAAMHELGLDFEVLVVDDGSTDRTASIVGELGTKYEQIALVRHPSNRGYGAALRSGFSRARKQLVAFTDADGQFELRELERLISLTRHHDIACGYRLERKDSFGRHVGSRVYNLLVRALLRTTVRDCDCALKVFRRAALRALRLESDGFLINAEMLMLARQHGFSVVEVGVTHRPRLGGQSTVRISHGVQVFRDALFTCWRKVLFPGRDSHDGDDWSFTRHWIMGVGLAIAAAVLLLTNLNYPLIEPDEARYAQIALEMYQSGDAILPTLRGEPYFDKPPLLYWATMLSYGLFGQNHFAARLPVAAAGWLTVLATFLLGRYLVGARAAWLGGVALLMSVGFLLSGRFLTMDGLLATFTTVSLLAAYIALEGERHNYSWWTLAGTACGLGVMTKGPVAVIICIPPIVLAHLLGPRRAAKNRGHVLAFLTPMVLISAPWFVRISIEYPSFFEHFVVRHHFVRFANAFNQQQPWWYYLPVIAIGVFPTSILLPALARHLLDRRASARICRTPALGYCCLSAVWIVFFFSLADCKLPTYLLPALPMLALAIGKMLHDNSDQRRPDSLTDGWPSITVIAIVSIASLTCALADLYLGPATRLDVVLASGSMLLGATLLVGLMRRPGLATMSVAIGACLIVGCYSFLHVLPEVARWRSSFHRAAELQRSRGDDSTILLLGLNPDAAALSIEGNNFVALPQANNRLPARLANDRKLIVVAPVHPLTDFRSSLYPDFRLRRHSTKSWRQVYTADRARLATSPLSPLR